MFRRTGKVFTFSKIKINLAFIQLSKLEKGTDVGKEGYSPVSTRRCFDVYATSIILKRRRMDVKTTSGAKVIAYIVFYWKAQSCSRRKSRVNQELKLLTTHFLLE